jgi:hypothetical protein
MLNQNQLNEMKEVLSSLGMEMSDDELMRGYKEFVEDYSNFQKEMLLKDVCLN